MWWKLAVKRIRAPFTVIALVGSCLSILVGCENPETVLVIEKPTAVYGIVQASSQVPNTNVQLGNVIATLRAGETARAVGVYHGQDHDGFHVRLADGTEGLILAGDTFKVTSR